MITEPAGSSTAEKPSEAVESAEPERLFEARTWKSARGGTSLVLEETAVGDTDANLWVPTGSNGRPHLDWVVVGGESGHGARPMHPAWVRSIRDECASQGIPFWFKQWGAWGPAPWRVERADGESIEDYKARAEAMCATHAYAVWANDYGHQPYEPGHKPWSAERTSLDGGTHAPIRRWGKKAAGCELDGQTWLQFPECVA
jgi:hypothetical protein